MHALLHWAHWGATQAAVNEFLQQRLEIELQLRRLQQAAATALNSSALQINAHTSLCIYVIVWVCVCHKRIISGQYKSAHPLSTHKQVPVLSVCARRYVCVFVMQERHHCRSDH